MWESCFSHPWDGSVDLVSVKELPAASVSLSMAFAGVLFRSVTVPPSATVPLSLLATGGSLTGVTVIETVAVPLHLGAATGGGPVVRSGERRVGEEGRSRWSPYHLKKKRGTAVTGVSAVTRRWGGVRSGG